MPAEGPAPALILLAKSPIPGQVKTRLMPELSAHDAAEVAAALIRASVRLAVHAWTGPVFLHGWPDLDHDVFNDLAESTRIQLGVQIEGGLGEKISGAICSHTAKGIPTAVMGCDIPHCPPCQLQLAGESLKAGRNVIGPGTDGGYYLIGLQNCQPGLFSGISWGGVDVFPKTMALAAALGIEFTVLDTLRDIDDYRDLVALADQIPILKQWSI